VDALARERGYRVWVCGGSVRDWLLGTPALDLDLAVQGRAIELGQALAEATGGHFVLLKEAYDTCRVVIQGRQVDLAGLRGPTIEADLTARDFTVNAVAVEAGSGKILDPTGGIEDLAKGVLKTAGPGVLRQDPLRVLRGFRFVASLGLAPAPQTMEELKAAGPGLFGVARERVGHEWRIMCAGQWAAEALVLMDQAMVLTRLVPELSFGRGVEQNPYHHLDVFWHQLECAWHAAKILAGEQTGGLSQEIIKAAGAGARERSTLITAALMHDVGKPFTRKPKAPGWNTFYRHESVGAELAGARTRALGLTNAEAQAVELLVRLHMRPMHLSGLMARGRLSTRALNRLVLAAGRWLEALIVLAMADTMAGRGPQRPVEAEQNLAAVARELINARITLARAQANPPLVNGHDVMAVAGIGPGPMVGRILKELREAQLEGRITTREQAIEMLKRLARSTARG